MKGAPTCTNLRSGELCDAPLVQVEGMSKGQLICPRRAEHDGNRRSLIASENYTADELTGQLMEPRPGTGMHAVAVGRQPNQIRENDRSSGVVLPGGTMTWADRDPASIGTFRKLDQHETDCLIVRELETVIALDEAGAFVELWGGKELPAVIHTVGLQNADAWKFERQKGGIHSDPLIRIIAFRAWGRRDIDWTPPVARPRFDPPMHNIPATRKTKPGKPTGRRFSHQNGCSDPNCDGQCVER